MVLESSIVFGWIQISIVKDEPSEEGVAPNVPELNNVPCGPT